MFVDGLSTTALAELERLGGRRRYAAGETLFLEGDRAGEALVLMSGEVKISVGSQDGREVILDVLEAGSLIGELAAIDGEPRSATVAGPRRSSSASAMTTPRRFDEHTLRSSVGR
ncbi:MAG: cyclic nucleotide-binding domain-containing protein [Actinobacteria bacterium]|nr:cyclic nucleotide-binding domain-containing protein [Actinomycetota bacterium]